MKKLMLAVVAAMGFAGARGENIEVTREGDPLEVVTSEESFLPLKEGTLLIANRKLSDYRLVSAKIQLGWNPDRFDSAIYNLVKSEDSWEFQVQAIQDGDGNVKGVKARIYQNGDDIYVASVYARYADKRLGLGVDLDTTYTDSGNLVVKTTTSLYGSSYGLYQLTIKENISDEDVQTWGERTVTAEDTVTVGEDVFLRVDDTTSAESPFGGAPVTLASLDKLEIANRPTTLLDGALSGDDITFDIKGSVTDGEYSYAESVSTSEKLFAENLRLSDITGILSCDEMQNGTTLLAEGVVPCDDPTGKTSGIFFIERTDEAITFQSQSVNDKWNKTCEITLCQRRNSVYVKVTGGWWQNKTKTPLGTDMRTADVSGGGSKIGQYTVRKLRVAAKVPAQVTVTGDLTGLNRTAMTLSGRQNVSLESATALPSGTLDIQDGTDVHFRAPINPSAKLSVRIGPGAAFHTYKQPSGTKWTCGSNLKDGFDVDGGWLDLVEAKNGDAGNSFDSGFYVNSLTVQNGGRVTGFGPRVGNDTPAVWTIGAGTNLVTCGALLVGKNKYDTTPSRSFVLDVAADGTLVTTGSFEDFITGQNLYFGERVVKSGEGVWRIEGTSAYHGFTEVRGGTLVYGIEEPFPNAAGLVLNGGTLEIPAGMSVTTPTFEAMADSVSSIVVGEGATLTLHGPGEAAYPLYVNSGLEAQEQPRFTLGENARINITLKDKTSRVFVGSSACLTRAQLNAIRINGIGVAQRGDGSLTITGLMILLK